LPAGRVASGRNYDRWMTVCAAGAPRGPVMIPLRSGASHGRLPRATAIDPPFPRQRRAVRHTQHQHITGRKRHEVRHVCEQARDRANHVRCAGLLRNCTIHGDRDGEVVRRGQLGGRCHVWADGARTISRLDAHRRTIKTLMRHAEIHHHCVAGDHAVRRAFSNAASSAADHDAQRHADLPHTLAIWRMHRLAGREQCVAWLHKEHRGFGCRLVRRSVRCIAERCQRRRMIEQRAVDRPAQPPRAHGHVDGQSGEHDRRCLITNM